MVRDGVREWINLRWPNMKKTIAEKIEEAIREERYKTQKKLDDLSLNFDKRIVAIEQNVLTIKNEIRIPNRVRIQQGYDAIKLLGLLF